VRPVLHIFAKKGWSRKEGLTMRYFLVVLPILIGLTACVVQTPAPVRTTYVAPALTTTYVAPAAPSSATVIQSP
jgi:hypothetical protein